MKERYYLIQVVYEDVEGKKTWTNHHLIEAKNKKVAVEGVLNKIGNFNCLILGIKRMPRKIVELVLEHNAKIKGEM